MLVRMRGAAPAVCSVAHLCHRTCVRQRTDCRVRGLFWGWLWGIWGMLLGIPIVVICKVVSEHVEELHPVAELLGD